MEVTRFGIRGHAVTCQERQTNAKPCQYHFFFKISPAIISPHKRNMLGPVPSDGTQKYRTVSFLRFSQFLPIEKIKKYTSGLKKILKIFLNVTAIILSVSAKNLDFIPYVELVMAI